MSVNIPLNNKRTAIKGFAFVSFSSEEDVRQLLNQPLLVIRGKKLAITKALSSSEASKKTKGRQAQKLFIRGLPAIVEVAHIKQIFGQFGAVDLVIIPKKKQSGQGKGIAYVVMAEKEAFEEVLKNMDSIFYG